MVAGRSSYKVIECLADPVCLQCVVFIGQALDIVAFAFEPVRYVSGASGCRLQRRQLTNPVNVDNDSCFSCHWSLIHPEWFLYESIGYSNHIAGHFMDIAIAKENAIIGDETFELDVFPQSLLLVAFNEDRQLTSKKGPPQ